MVPKKQRPPMTPEARENMMIDLAMDQAEKQLMEGTASSQIIVHYLKLASINKRLELEKMQAEIELLNAKREAALAEAKSDEKYEAAIRMMGIYRGEAAEEEYYDQEY